MEIQILLLKVFLLQLQPLLHVLAQNRKLISNPNIKNNYRTEKKKWKQKTWWSWKNSHLSIEEMDTETV